MAEIKANLEEAIKAETKHQGYEFRSMEAAEMAIPDHPIPVMATINGKKVQVGEGTIDPETFIFTTRLNDDSPYTQILLDRARVTEDYSGWVTVSEMNLTQLGDVPFPKIELPETVYKKQKLDRDESL